MGFVERLRSFTRKTLIYSLLETAKANGFEPYLGLRNALRALRTTTTV